MNWSRIFKYISNIFGSIFTMNDKGNCDCYCCLSEENETRCKLPASSFDVSLFGSNDSGFVVDFPGLQEIKIDAVDSDLYFKIKGRWIYVGTICEICNVGGSVRFGILGSVENVC